MKNEIEYYMDCLTTALEISDNISKESMLGVHEYYQKGDRDYALDIDLKIETEIKRYFREIDNSIPILGEEFEWDGKSDSEYFWVIDPIDGTVNYSRLLPLFGTSIALIQDDKPVLSGISFPILGERYTAMDGKGAFLNNEKIFVSNVAEIADAIVGMGDFAVGENSTTRNKSRFEAINYFGNRALRIRMPGTAAMQLAWLASGKIDVSLTLSNKAWDVQAGVLIVREAGGDVFDFDGSIQTVKSKYTLATNKALKQTIVDYFAALTR
jgi:myo-inositol-1(or 4)-monophosphatase